MTAEIELGEMIPTGIVIKLNECRIKGGVGERYVQILITQRPYFCSVL